MAGIHFDITGDNRNFVQVLQRTQSGVKQTADAIEQSGLQIESVFDKIRTAASLSLAGFSVKEFVTKVAHVRGEFQQLEVAFKTMLGNEEKAISLMNDLTKLSATTPFDLKGVSDSAKQLLAYGMDVSMVTDTLRRLGDISAGLGIQIGDLTYLYGTTMAQGRLYTNDLNQFTGRGIPMISELAKQFGVAEEKVKELVTAGKVGFPEVQKVIESLTNEGGKFAGLMEAQSKTIVGQISNLEDSIDMMFNEIGKSSEGAISTAIEGASYLVEHYQTIGRIIEGLIITYGLYRAALIVNTVASSGLTAIEAIHYAWLVAQQRAQALLNATMLSNPYVAVAAALGAVISAIIIFNDKTSAAEEAQKRMNDVKEQAAEKTEQQKTKIDLLLKAAQDEKESLSLRKKAIDELNKIIPHYNAQLDVTTGKYEANKKALDNYISSLTKKYEIEGAKDLLAKLGKEKAKAQLAYNKAVNGYNSASNAGEGVSYTTSYGVVGNTTQDLIKKRRDELAKSKQALLNIKTQEDEILKIYRAGLTEDAIQSSDKTVATSKEDKKAKAAAEKAAKAAAERRQKLFEENSRWNEETLKQEQDYQTALEELRIASITDSAEREREVQKAEFDKQLAQIQQQEDEYKKANYEHAQKIFEITNTNAKKQFSDTEQGRLGWRGTSLTDTQQSIIKAQRDKVSADISDYNRKQEEENRKKLEKDAQYHRDYLIEYGTFEQKRQALQEEYATKIASEKNKDRKKSLQEELKSKLSELDFNELKRQINWDFIFSDIKNVDATTLQTVNDQLKAFMDTARELSPDELKVVSDALQQIREKMDFSRPLETIQNARNEYQSAKAEYDKYKASYDDAKSSGDSVGQKKAAEGMTKSSQKMVKAKNREQKAFSQVADVANQYAETLKEVGKTIGGAVGQCVSLAAAGIQAGIGLVTGIKAFQQAASNMERALAILAIIQSALQVINMLTSLFTSGDHEQYEAMAAQYENLSKIWDELIDKKKEYIGISYGEEASKIEAQVRQLTRDMQKVARDAGNAWLDDRSKAAHSKGYRIWAKLTESDFQRASEAIGYNIDRGDKRVHWLFELNHEQIQALKEMPTFWAKLDDNTRKYLDEILKAEEQFKDAQNKVKEQQTSISFDNLYDDFIDTLSDMESEWGDFNENLSETFMKAALAQMVGMKYREQLKKWYNNFANAMGDGVMEKYELDTLKNQYKEITMNAIEERKSIEDAIGTTLSYAQEKGSNGSFQSMGEETANELNGRFTAVQIHTSDTAERMLTTIELLNGIAVSQSSQSLVLSEIRNIMINSNSYLEDIVKYAKLTYSQFGDKLDSIVINIKNL